MNLSTNPEFRPTEDQVIIDLLKSIALEENALAHLIDAEAEKIQAFVGKNHDFPTHPNTAEIITFNKQVIRLMDVIVMKEWLLLRKLTNVLDIRKPVPIDEGEE